MDLNAKKTALVAVHFQHDIVSADGAFGPFFAAEVTRRDVFAVNQKLLAGARAAGVTVVYIRVAWKPDYSDMVANSPLLGMVVQAKCLVDGSEKAKIVPQLEPHAGDLVVTHTRAGGFSASPLDTLLRSRGIDTVLFSGVATNASVESTARQSSDLGYRTVIVADACSAASEAAHEASIGSLGLLAEIATSGDVLAALTSTAPSAAKS